MATKKSPATARFQDKREAILDGAARLFNQHGVRAAMMSSIAASVGLATNSLTYYYRKKDDLVAACLLRAAEAMGAAADEAAKASTLNLRVQGFLSRYLGLLAAVAQGRHPELMVFSDLLSMPPPHRTAVLGAYTQLFRRVRRLLDVPGAPKLPELQRNARAHLLLSSTSWARAWLQRHEPDDYAAVAQRLGALLLHGLALPGQALMPPQPSALSPPWLALGDGGDSSSAASRAADLRAAYLRAATRLVNEHGVLGASVDRIAAELQLTKGSFYHHHETKEELIAACFERTFAVMRAAQNAAQATGGSGLQRLVAACRMLLDFQMSSHGPLLRVTAWTGLPDALRLDTRRTMERLSGRFASLVVDGMADHSLRVLDPHLAAHVVSGMLNAAAEIERWVRGVDAANVFELYAMPLFTGLAPPSG